VQTALWIWSGSYFGYREDDLLWAYHGRLVGKFHGDDVYGADGSYLGEIRNADRLITKTSKKNKRAGAFGVRQRGSRGIRGTRGSRGPIGGYEDFPSAETFR
jgi:hypothetical protein